MTSLVGFIVALGLLVTVHEWGHYRVAVACGIHVQRFSIGFGPTLWRWHRPQRGMHHDIEFVIGAIPLGGYVKLLDGTEDDVASSDKRFAFDQQPLRSRVAVVLAGPVANFVLAVLLYGLVFLWGNWQVLPLLSVPAPGSPAQLAGVRGSEVVRAVGTEPQDMREVASLDELRWWLLMQSSDQALHFRLSERVAHPSPAGDALGPTRDVKITPVLQEGDGSIGLSLEALGLNAPQSPALLRDVVPQGAAERSGLQRGDRVLSIDEHPIVDAYQLKQVVRDSSAHSGVEQLWRIERSGAVLDVPVLLDVVNEGGKTIGRLGALLGQPSERVWVSDDPMDAILKAFTRVADVTQLTLQTLWGMLTGEASWTQLGGPIAIAEGAGQSMHLGWQSFVSYLALLSVSLGVFNLLPIPALDGGHLLYYLYEFLVGRAPAKRWVILFQQAGFFVLMALTAVALLNDLNRLGG
jgi:regulator of sigma E protease